ncbi:hypothetical protein RHMOL_Rhmol05G0253900 [Rhododendron molle]|uniref:Uncharacterized protein n=1 Tax=Rhododendron molle TaxID=49168 RepID=A0ACC0NUH1_RHOML|nr:hypothetical protein RHMOL_Rhmol05G0253900 [Rhododendron molle]
MWYSIGQKGGDFTTFKKLKLIHHSPRWSAVTVSPAFGKPRSAHRGRVRSQCPRPSANLGWPTCSGVRPQHHWTSENIPGFVKEDLPPTLDSTSLEPPPLFDGTTRLYIAYVCPFAQRVWIARNYKGLQDEIKLVAIDLGSKPTWYKEKVYRENKVPSLEHNNKVIGESLDLLQYLEDNFEGPKLFPNDPSKQQFAEELLEYTNTFNKTMFTYFKGDPVKETGSAFDYLETALNKFEDGLFFLGQFSLVDIAYGPFIGSFQLIFHDVWKYDITAGRPKLGAWIEEMNKIDAYTQTKYDRAKLVESYKKRFLVVPHTFN